MIRTAITPAMLLCTTAAQDLPHVRGLEIKASRITTAPADYLSATKT